MAYLEQLKTAGLFNDLQKLLSDAALSGEAVKEVMQAIDEQGTKGPKVMKLVGNLQRQNKLKPGLWKELVAFTSRVEGAATQQPAAVAAAPQGEAQVSDTPVPATTPSNVIPFDVKLSEKDEEKLQARIKKEEEALRKKLLDKEKKFRERAHAKLEARAKKQGVKVEEAAEVKEAKEKISELNKQIKELRALAKVQKEKIKAIKATQPKKERKKKEKKPKEGEAAAAPVTEAPAQQSA